MKISFHGAAQVVTGSKHLLTFENGKKILLDCGMFQGMGQETISLNQHFGFDPLEIDAVVISHAHIDHTGLLPRLVKEGYKNPIYCTRATAKFTEVLLKDSAHIQEMDVMHVNKRKAAQGKELVQVLYSTADAMRVFPLIETKDVNQWHEILDGIFIKYLEAGHILGSAFVQIKYLEKGEQRILTFSGDIGRYNDDILKSPATFEQSDYILMESTYGNRLHGAYVDTIELLLKHIENTCLGKKGKLIIPAFSVGRTQELLYSLNKLSLENRLPKVKYYLDSPMSIEITELTKTFPQLFNNDVQNILKRDEDPFDFPGLEYIEDVSASKKLNFSKEPAVIISASGMAEAGRAKHHIANNIENARNTILLVGYCEPQSLGGRLAAGNEEVGIFGEKYQVLAEVAKISSLSAHGDYIDLMKWISCQDPKKVKHLFLVHGDPEAQFPFKERLSNMGFEKISIPKMHESFSLK